MSVAASAVNTGCDSVDDDRIPPMPVYISFSTEPDWEVYGVTGACSSRNFIRDLKEPSNYPWTAMTYTGFGGVLLVSDINGDPQAYDLACPYECRKDVRIYVGEDLKAHCSGCGSVYDVFTNYGSPLSGPAAEDGYALQRYSVGRGQQGEYRIVTR